MLTDNQVLELTVTLFGFVAIATIAGLIVYFAYLRPNFFYGDHVVLSIQSNGKTLWVKNDAKLVSFTENKAEASVLQFLPGLSGQKGQLFEGNTTTFELRHPYYGAFLTATCRSRNSDQTNIVAEFSTTTGSQIGVVSQGNHILDIVKGKALRDGGQYHMQITGFDCESGGCEIESACSATGCYFNTNSTVATINCDLADNDQQLWTFTKVRDKTNYIEYQSPTDFIFTTSDSSGN